MNGFETRGAGTYRPRPIGRRGEAKCGPLMSARARLSLALAACLAVALFVPVTANVDQVPDRIVIVDGDTIASPCTVPVHGFAEKVHLLDVDSPETLRPHCECELWLGLEGRENLAELLRGHPVQIVRSGKKDRYGRTRGRSGLRRAAEKVEITVEGISRKLLDAYDAALRFERAGAAVAAMTALAKLLGLMAREKRVVSTPVISMPSPIPLDRTEMTVSEWQALYSPKDIERRPAEPNGHDKGS